MRDWQLFVLLLIISIVSLPVISAPMSNGQSINGVIFNEPWYEVKNVAGTATIFLIDKDGDMYLDADAIAVSSAITGPFANSLIIQDAADEIFVINAANAYFSGKVYPNFATLPTMDGDDMVIQNVAGTPVAIFDGGTNSLYLSGDATHDAVAVEPRNALEFAGATRAAGSYPAGTHEHIVLPSMAIDFSAGMTFEGWFYFDALQNWAHPVSMNDGTNIFQILHHSTNATLRFNTVNSTSSEWIEATGIIDLNEWIHIAYTVTPTGGGVATGRLYKNGLLIDSDAGQRSFPNTTWTTGMFAWGSASDGNMSFDGKLDEFRLWTDVRTQSEIQADMFTTYGTLVDNTNLAAYWDFNDVLGSQLIDAHSGNFHGTLQDMNSDAWVSSYTERTLTIVSGGNGALAPTGAQTIADGQSFPIVATPSAGYTFEYWAKTAGTGTVTFSDSTNDTTWVTVTGGAAEVTAYFDYTTWANTTTLTLNTTASYANVATTQTDFPVLIRLTSGNFTFADARGNGEDIRFTTAANVPMDYEIERWDSTNALAEVWVKVASIAGNSTTDIKMFWGRADVTSKSDGEAVFPLADSYEGVWHLNDITDLDDATANAGTGTNSGTVNIAGNIGQAVDYEGADWISLPAANFSDLTTQVSVSCWIYGDAAMQPQNNLLFRGSDVSGNNALAAYVPWSDQNVFWDAGNVGVSFNRLYGAVDASKWEGAWVYYTFTKDQTTGALEIFINGNSEMSGTGYTYTFSTIVTFLLGAYTTGLYNYDGIIDEFRVSSTVRSDDWVKLSYENQRAENYLINSRAGNTITLVDGGANGSIANEGANVVADGNPFALTATPDAGYDVWWVQTAGAGTAVFTDAHAASTSVTVTGGNATITCYFNYTNWSNNTTWTLNTTPAGADVSGDVTNFPVLIRLTTSNFIFAQAQTNGEDIRFAATDGSPLDYEIERWDNAGQVAEIWVKAPTITGNSTTDIKMYWGNSDAPSLSDGEAVFETSNNFAAVWHLEEEGNTNANGYEDATANNVHGTGVSMTASSDVDAVIGRGQDFDGTADYIDVSDISSSFANGITVCVWTQWDAINDWARIIDFSDAGESDDNIFITAVGSTTELDASCYSGATNDGLSVSGYITTNTWMHTCYTNTSSGDAVVYKNGVVVGSESSNTAPTSVTRQSNLIAKSNWPNGFLNGQMDELSLHNTARSTDWVKLMYESQRYPSTLLQTTHYETWNYNRTITLNTTVSGADVAGTVTDFPVLIRLTGSDFTFGQARTNGEDIRFTDATSGTALDYEIERWDNAGELAEIWVNVPSITGNSTTTIKMYWGQSDAPSLSDGEAVFETSNSFSGVWHLSEDGNTTADGYLDATANNNDGTGVSLTAASDVEGITGIGHLLDGDADYIRVDDHATLDFTNNYTLSAWVKPDNSNNSWEGIINKDRSITSGYYLMHSNNGSEASFSNQFHDGGYQVSGTNKYYTTDKWLHVTGTYDGADLKLFVNGEEIGSKAVVSAASTNAQSLFIGGINGYADDFFDGYMDEVRVASSARSADWIKLAYENQRLTNTIFQTAQYETWSYNTTLTLNTTVSYADVTNDVTNFPVLVRLNGAAHSFNFAQARTNGEDIRFTDAATGAVLSYEIERWDAGGELAEIWVKVPTITGNSSTDIKMFWGRPDVPSESDGAAVFETTNDFVGVWHLGEDGNTTANGYADATLNDNDGTGTGLTTAHDKEGIVGVAQDFDGTGDYITVADDATLDLGNTFTVSGWVSFEEGVTPSGYFRQWSRKNAWDDPDGWDIQLLSGDDRVIQARGSNATTSNYTVVTSWAAGGWQYITAVFNGASVTMYANGVSVGSSAIDAVVDNNVPLYIAANSTGTENWIGKLDEMRLEDGNRSDDWIKLAYENQRSENYLFNQRPELTITAGSNGSVDNAGTSDVVNPMALHATPAAGYTFNGWSRPTNAGNLTIADSALLTTTVTATGSGEVQANFVAKPDNALHFTGATNNAGSYPAGTHEYVELPDINFQTTGTYTVEAWIYWDNLQNWSRPLYFREGSASNDGFSVWSDGTGTTLRFSVCDGGGTCTTLPIASYVTVDTWIHLAFSATSSGDITIYKNGEVVGSGTAPNFSGDGAAQYCRLGSGAGNANDESFDGYIDDVRIWTDIRTQTEIQNDMFNLYGSYIMSDNMLAHWDFNHVMGDTLYESTGTYDGVLIDMDHDDWVGSYTTNTLTVTAGSNGTVAPTPIFDMATGHSGYVTATPNTGYTFNGWTETTNPSNITLDDANDFRTSASLTGDGEVTAAFTTEPENALTFDGSNEYITLPAVSIDWSSGFTFEAWIYMDVVPTTRPVFFSMSDAGANAVNIGGFENTDDFDIGINEASYLSKTHTDFFTLDAWTHIAVTVASDGSTVIYKNGGQVATANLHGVSTNNRSDVYIGYNVYASYMFNGKMDEVRLWNDVRTGGEVYRNHFESYETLHNSGNLVAYWDFNQSMGDVVRDKKAGYHGMRNNMEVGDWGTSWTRRTLTINSGSGGSVWPSGVHTAMDNRNYYISATPDANYYFNNWTDDGGAVTASFTASGNAINYAKITGGNGAVRANFVQDNTAPSVPTSITTSGFTNGGFYLNWGASTDAASGVAGYKVYRNSSTLIGTVTSGTSLWIGRGGYQTYSVLAYDNAGNESAQSRSMYHFEAEARSNSYDITFYDGYYAGDLDDNSGAAPDWIDWNSVVFSGGTYRVSLRKSSNDATYAHSINYQFNNSTYGSISRQEHDGGWTSWKVVYDNNTITAPTGTYKFSALFYGINWNVDWVQMLPE